MFPSVMDGDLFVQWMHSKTTPVSLPKPKVPVDISLKQPPIICPFINCQTKREGEEGKKNAEHNSESVILIQPTNGFLLLLISIQFDAFPS